MIDIKMVTEPIKTVKDRIVQLIDDKLFDFRVTKEKIGSLVISELELVGRFLISNWIYYYFSNESKLLYFLKSDDFKRFISVFTELNKKDTYFNAIIEAIDTYISIKWVNIDFKNFSYYDKKNNELFIFNNKDVIHITGKSIKIIDNWKNDIIFKPTNFDKWNFIKNPNTDIDYISKLLSSVNFKKSILDIDEIHLVLEYYIYSLFFPELLQNKVIVNIIWDMWSGKSYFLELLYKILQWNSVSLSTLPDKDSNLELMLASNTFVFLDNVEINVRSLKSKVDMICSASTGASSQKRKLFTNETQFNQKLSTNIAFTAIEPQFNRRDVADRSLIFILDRRKEYSSSNITQATYLNNRDTILSMLCYKFQEILKNISVYKEYSTNFRMADFATFILNNFKNDTSKLENIFKKLEIIQQEFTNTNDMLLIILEDILEFNSKVFDENKFYSASELHKILSKHSYHKDNRHLKYAYDNPKSLWKALNNNIKSYRNTAWIDIQVHMKGWNKRVYSITKLQDKE